MANLAELSAHATRLCPHCVTPLFGQVAYCPYCGKHGTAAVEQAEPPLVPLRFETIGANDAGPVVDLSRPMPMPAAVPARRNRGGIAAFGVCVLALVGSAIY